MRCASSSSAPEDVIADLDTTVAGALVQLIPEMARRRPDARASATWGDVDRNWLFTAAATALDE